MRMDGYKRGKISGYRAHPQPGSFSRIARLVARALSARLAFIDRIKTTASNALTFLA
jgi:hypothetical protein